MNKTSETGPKTSRGLRKGNRTTPTKKTGVNRGWLLATVIGGLLFGLLLASWWMRRGGGEIEGVQVYTEVPQGHQEGRLSYPQEPPVGGIHNPAWLNCGIYDEPVPSENAVHSMEHGAVWITYDPDLPEEAVEQLRSTSRARNFVLLSPYEDLPAPVVASAWGVQLQLEGADDPRLLQFIRNYQQGPQTPELGAPCSGGIGEPVER